MVRRGNTVGVLLACTVCAGCSVNPPAILQIFWQINYRAIPPLAEPVEELSLFLHLQDEDGDDDIESISLLNDAAELYWGLHGGTWERTEISEESWFGSSELRMYRDGRFPRGAYRLVVTDLAGERGEGSLFISADRSPPVAADVPSLVIDSEMITITGSHESTGLWFYDGGGEVVKVLMTSSKLIDLGSVLNQAEKSRSTSVSAYRFDNAKGVGLISQTYHLDP